MEKRMRYIGLNLTLTLFIPLISCSSGPENAAEKFYSHIKNERWEKAADMGTQRTKGILGLAQGMMKDKKPSFVDKKIENIHCEELENGNYHCQAITVEGDTIAPLTLINRDGAWEVDLRPED